MEKLNLNYHEVNDKDLTSFVKENKELNEIIRNLHITDKEIIDNIEIFMSFLKHNAKCENCRSMNDCRQDKKGYIYKIGRDEDNFLYDYFTICPFYTDYYNRKDNLVYTTFDEKDILDSSQKNFMFDNAGILGDSFIDKILSIYNNQYVSGAFVTVKDAHVRLKLMQSLSYRLLLSRKVSIVKFSDLLKQIKSEFNIRTSETTYDIVSKSEILIIDGLGNEAITTWSRDDILFSLLDNRIQSHLTTILCSEFELDELKKVYKLNYNDEIKANQLIDKIRSLG